MATPIPAFVSQYVASSTDTIQVTSGTAQTLATTRYYYLASNRTSASNGQRLTKAVENMLNASLGGTTWICFLDSTTTTARQFKVLIQHDSGSSKTITMGASLQAALGFSSASYAIASGATLTAENYSPLWWTPNMTVSMTGPVLFDPAVNFGVPSSVGAAQRAPDMTAAYVSNGVQYETELMFNGVDGYYKIRPQPGHTNEDLETWWSNGPRKGRRLLWWRNRLNTVGVSDKGSASPWNYVELNPQPDLRQALPAVPTAPPMLTHWDVSLKLWVTENGETPLSD
jgi:hypothetical protein